MARPAEMWDADSEYLVDQLISQYDDGSMPLPDLESEPHLLISKVRKHYMEYIIKLLSVNYEKNQKLLNKNIYLPSAIWRCAKYIETKAAQTCMVVQLYRKSIIEVITELKSDTKRGKLNKRLYECLHRPPDNEKKLQTTLSKFEGCICQCHCNQNKKRCNESPNMFLNHHLPSEPLITDEHVNGWNELNTIPVVLDSHMELQQADVISEPEQSPQTQSTFNNEHLSPKPSIRMSVESQDSDELMMQLEKLFQQDPNDEDLFDGALCDNTDSSIFYDNSNRILYTGSVDDNQATVQKQDIMIENQAAQIKSLDERIASLAGMLVNNIDNNGSQQKAETVKNKKNGKWLCEEYFMKSHLMELLDQIGDSNRKKLIRVNDMFLELFGYDSDEEEGVVSPLVETPEFVISCKERIASWVVKLLTPHYAMGKIRGKVLFKALAKHLIRLIYQCSRYPNEYEVQSFVADFLENHKVIKCEADFKEFKIDNI